MAGRDNVQPLLDFLSGHQPGPFGQSDEDQVVELLQLCWRDLRGSRREQMHDGKLNRIESVDWQPPVLSFVIERHGGAALGSTRAELQRWDVDVERRTAEPYIVGKRQISPRQPPLKIQPIADELAAAILDGKRDDARLRWRKDGSTVRVSATEALPPAFSQTQKGRRDRLALALDERLTARGWRVLARLHYAPPAEE